MSVRFLGRRVYLGLAVVLSSTWHAGQMTAAARLSAELDVPVRTLQRWRQWWRQQLPLTPLWQAPETLTSWGTPLTRFFAHALPRRRRMRLRHVHMALSPTPLRHMHIFISLLNWIHLLIMI